MAHDKHTTHEPHEGVPELLRPRFFPGQLLTDRNLTDIIRWVKSRFLFARGENAWGIVCGLNVSKGKKDSTCEVSAGVAVDVAGNPIAFHDSDPVAWKTVELPSVASIDRDNCTNINASQQEKVAVTIGPYENVTAKKWAVFGLSVCAYDRDEDPVPTACGKGRKCEDTRTRESGELHLTRIRWSDLTQPLSTKPQPDRATELLAEFEKSYADAFNATNGVTLDAQAIRKWFITKWNADPQLLHAYPGLPEVVEREWAKWFGNAAHIAKLLTWLTDSLRRAVQPCDFAAAHCPANAVPLARIWAEAVGNYYHVRVIEDVSPWRREYGSQIATRLNPRRYLGRNVQEVIAELGRLGVPATKEVAAIPGTGADLNSLYNAESEIGEQFQPGEPVVALHWKAATGNSAFADSVFAFRKGTATDTELTTGKPLNVRLFVPTPGMKIGEVKYGNMPPTEEELPIELDALPAGGKVRIAVELDAFNFAGGKRIFKFKYFDELTGIIKELPEATSQQRIIVANVQIPKGDRDVLSVTIIGEEQVGTPPRTKAVSEPIKIAKVRSIAVANHEMSQVSQVVLTQLDGSETQPVVRLLGNGARLPLRVSVDGLLSNAILPLRYQKDVPTDPAAGQADMVLVRHETGTRKVGVVAIPMPMPTEPEYQYWVYGASGVGYDFDFPAIKRVGEISQFVDSTKIPKISFSDLKLLVTVKFLDLNRATLVLQNQHSELINIVKGSVRQLAKTAKLVDVAAVSIAINAMKSTPDFDRVNDTDYWRVELEYTLGAETTKFFAAIDVKAEPVVPVSPAPVPGPA